MRKFYSFCRATSTISSGCSADAIEQNRKNDRFYLEDLLTLPKQKQYDKSMTNTYWLRLRCPQRATLFKPQRAAPMTHRVLNNVGIQTWKHSIPHPQCSTRTMWTFNVGQFLFAHWSNIKSYNNILHCSRCTMCNSGGASHFDVNTKNRLNLKNSTCLVVAGAGFEPTTFGLWARRATRLLHPAIFTFLLFSGSRWLLKYNTTERVECQPFLRKIFVFSCRSF